MMALRPVGSSWQNTTCSWPVAVAKTPSGVLPGAPEGCGSPGNPDKTVSLRFGPAGVVRAAGFGGAATGVVCALEASLQTPAAPRCGFGRRTLCPLGVRLVTRRGHCHVFNRATTL